MHIEIYHSVFQRLNGEKNFEILPLRVSQSLKEVSKSSFEIKLPLNDRTFRRIFYEHPIQKYCRKLFIFIIYSDQHLKFKKTSQIVINAREIQNKGLDLSLSCPPYYKQYLENHIAHNKIFYIFYYSIRRVFIQEIFPQQPNKFRKESLNHTHINKI